MYGAASLPGSGAFLFGPVDKGRAYIVDCKKKTRAKSGADGNPERRACDEGNHPDCGG